MLLQALSLLSTTNGVTHFYSQNWQSYLSLHSVTSVDCSNTSHEKVLVRRDTQRPITCSSLSSASTWVRTGRHAMPGRRITLPRLHSCRGKSSSSAPSQHARVDQDFLQTLACSHVASSQGRAPALLRCCVRAQLVHRGLDPLQEEEQAGPSDC